MSILIAFFVSGFVALIYEVAWSKTLTILFGVSIYGQSLTLGIFMGGLALGAVLGGKFMARTKFSPLFIYGVLELFIGLLGIVSSYVLVWGRDMSFDGFYLGNVLRLFLCLIVFLPSTIAMGASFPVLYTHLKRGVESDIERISLLYVFNTLGALSGTFFSAIVFMPMLGLKATLLFASLINFLLFLFFMIKSKGRLKVEIPLRQEEKKKWNFDFKLPYSGLIALLVAGFQTMLYEITFTRALHLSIGSSTFTFSMILFSFLAGISLGAWKVKKVVNISESYMSSMICRFQVYGAMSMAIFFFFASRIPYVMGDILSLTQGDSTWTLVLQQLIVLILAGPIAFFQGACFPLICKILTRDKKLNEEAMGIAFSWNTVGNILGALVSGFILLPLAGPFRMAFIGLVGHGVICFLVGKKNCKIGLSILGLFLVGGFIFLDQNNSDKGLFIEGHYSRDFGKKKIYFPKYLKMNDQFIRRQKLKIGLGGKSKILSLKHGVMNSVAVVEDSVNRRLVLDGKTDASVGDFLHSDMPTQIMLGELPLVLAPETKNGLVIGLGSGVTGGFLAQFTEKLDILEIEKEVLNASKYFNDYNFAVGERENVNIILKDAREFVRTRKSHYDYISSEPSNLWMAGVANLYTQEFFQECFETLKEGGVMISWIHVYKLSLEDFQMVLRTFSKVFSEVHIWGSLNMGDIFLIGMKDSNSWAINKKRLQVIEKQLKKNIGLAESGLLNSNILHSYFLGSWTYETLVKETGHSTLNTDDCSSLEYSASRNMYQSQVEEIFKFLKQ